MKTHAHLALLTAPLFSNNMGCNALTYGSLAILEKSAKRLGVAFAYTLAGNDRGATIPAELEGLDVRLVEQVPDGSLRGLVGSLIRGSHALQRRCARELASADVALDNAAGDSFSDVYGPGRFNQVTRRFRSALRAGKPLLLLPQTIGPFAAPSARQDAADLLRAACAVYARDPLSAACARELAPGIEVFETVDVAMFIPYTRPPTRAVGPLRVGINPSGLLWRGGYTRANQFGLRDDYPALIRHVVRSLLARGDVVIELLGHDISGPHGGNRNDDYYVCKLLQREFPECRVAPFFYSPIEAKSYIAGLDFLIGSRMHACIAAYSSGVPVLPLAYSRKFKGLFVEKLGYPMVENLDEADRQAVQARMEDGLDRLAVIRGEFPERLAALDREHEALINHISRKLSEVL